MSNIKDGGEIAGRDVDMEAVLRVRSGDIEAFSILVNKYQNRMLNTAFRMLGDYNDSCDAIQDSFISAFKALGSFRGEASFQTWLRRIVMNNARNRLKQKGREVGLVSLEGFSPKADSCPLDPPSLEASAFEQLNRKELQEGVQYCIDTLDTAFREVLILRDIQQYTYDEISSVLKLQDGTVKSRLFRARELLKDCLKKRFRDF